MEQNPEGIISVQEIKVAKEDQLLGAINIETSGDEQIIQTIAVNLHYHKKGNGKKLIEFAKKTARESGCTKLTVESFQSYGLQEFYEKVVLN